VNWGIATPLTPIENVLSRRLPKLSVALTVNVVEESVVTNVGVPDIKPLVLRVTPEGKLPLSNKYVTVVAGVTEDADN
jgi:hypothetical protein